MSRVAIEQDGKQIGLWAWRHVTCDLNAKWKRKGSRLNGRSTAKTKPLPMAVTNASVICDSRLWLATSCFSSKMDDSS